MRILLAMAFAGVMLAGCIELPPAVSPSSEPWSEGQPVWWVAWSHGCGFCAGTGPEFHMTAYAASGHAVRLEYGRGTEGITFAASVPAGLHATIRDLFEAHVAYGERSGGTDVERPVHVYSARGSVYQASSSINHVIGHALDRAAGPTGSLDVTDCGPDILVSFDPPLQAQHGCGIDAGEGWERVREQLQALR